MEPRGLLDARPQPVRVLERRPLGGDEPEYRDLVVRQIGERLEAAGAIVVVLHHPNVDVGSAVEALARQLLVAAARGPHARVVAAAEMHRSSDAGHVERGVDVIDCLGLEALGVEALLRALRLHLLVREALDQLGSVDLRVLAAGVPQLLDLPADEVHPIGEELERIGVHRARQLVVPDREEEQRTRQRDLDGLLGLAAEIGELLERERARGADLPLHAHRHLEVHLLAVVRVEGGGTPRARRESVHADHELVEELNAAEFAVGDHIDPGALLHRERVIDRAVLQLLQLLRTDLARRRV